jgi:hypothetical protein
MLISDSPPVFFKDSPPLPPEFKVCLRIFKLLGDSCLLFICSYGGDVTTLKAFAFVCKTGWFIKLLIFETIMPVCWLVVDLTTMFTFFTLLLLPEEVGLDTTCLRGGYCILEYFV